MLVIFVVDFVVIATLQCHRWGKGGLVVVIVVVVVVVVVVIIGTLLCR